MSSTASPPRLAATKLLLGGRPFLTALLVLLIVSLANAQPDTLWTRLHRVNESNPNGLGLAPAADGGYFFGGECTDYGSRQGWVQSFVIHTDSSGQAIWQSIDRFAERHQRFGGLIEAPDGGVYVVAMAMDSSHDDYAIIYKLDSEGNSVWSHYYGEGDFNDIVVGADGLAVAVGSTFEYARFGEADAYVVKIDENGEVIWRRVFGGNDNDDDVFIRILLTPDDGFLLVGATGVLNNGAQGWLMKIDSEGRRQWSKDYGGEESEIFRTGILTPDGGYLAGGSSTLLGNEPRFNNVRNFLVKVDSEGDTLWTRIFDGPITPNADDYIFNLTISPGSGYFAVGTGIWERDNQISALRLNEEGEVLWHLNMGVTYGPEAFHAVLPTPDGGYLIGGERLYSTGTWLVRTAPDSTALNAVVLLDPAFPSQFVIGAPYPNPFNSSVTISFSSSSFSSSSLRIYDQLGKQVAELYNGRLQSGQHNAVWSATNTPTGLYFCKVVAGSQTATMKVMLVK